MYLTPDKTYARYVHVDGYQTMTIRDRYARAAHALNLDLDTLHPERFRTVTSKRDDWNHFLDGKTVPEPVTVDFILDSKPNTWGQRLAAIAQSRAEAQTVLQFRAMSDQLDAVADDALTGADAYDHLMSTVNVDQLAQGILDGADAYLAGGKFDYHDPAVYLAAAEALLWLDLPLTGHAELYRAAMWVDPGELDPLVSVVTERTARGTAAATQRRFTDDDVAAHDRANRWLTVFHNQDTEASKAYRAGGGSVERPHELQNIGPEDRAVCALAIDGLQDFGLSLDVATSWEELQRRVEMFKVAGRRESVDAENVA